MIRMWKKQLILPSLNKKQNFNNSINAFLPHTHIYISIKWRLSIDFKGFYAQLSTRYSDANPHSNPNQNNSAISKVYHLFPNSQSSVKEKILLMFATCPPRPCWNQHIVMHSINKSCLMSLFPARHEHIYIRLICVGLTLQPNITVSCSIVGVAET